MSGTATALPSQWHGCYTDGWHGEIMPAAFAHPAKFSRALIRRIYDHTLSEGWLTAGDTVVDPFGGVALGALDAMWNGLHYVGVELEPRFVTLGEQNIAVWQFKYRDRPGLGSARLLQGDSRQLASVIQSAECVISSPPYSGLPVNDSQRFSRHDVGDGAMDGPTPYGSSPGQLGRMKEGVPPQVECVVGSPPYAEGLGHGGVPTRGAGRGDDPILDGMQRGYGSSDGQLAAMPEGRFDAVVSSPPYEGSISSKEDVLGAMQERLAKKGIGRECGLMRSRGGSFGFKEYQESDGSLDNQSGDTFWSAAREIVAQCHAILKPGGHAIWVVKDFVRKGKRVPFSDQWQALCESQDFRLVCRHRAMLVTHHGEQETIFGETEQITTERKSFFRRLAEKKGSPPIDFEDVICLEKA